MTARNDNRAKASAEHPPKRTITDGLNAYQDGIERVFGADSRHTRHIVSKGLTSESNNNLAERLQGTLRERSKVMRGLQDVDSARLILDGWTLHYNYFRPHESLNGRTPAEAAHVTIPFKDWPDVARNPFPTHSLPGKENQFVPRDVPKMRSPVRSQFRVRRMGR